MLARPSRSKVADLTRGCLEVAAHHSFKGTQQRDEAVKDDVLCFSVGAASLCSQAFQRPEVEYFGSSGGKSSSGSDRSKW